MDAGLGFNKSESLGSFESGIKKRMGSRCYQAAGFRPLPALPKENGTFPRKADQ